MANVSSWLCVSYAKHDFALGAILISRSLHLQLMNDRMLCECDGHQIQWLWRNALPNLSCMDIFLQNNLILVFFPQFFHITWHKLKNKFNFESLEAYCTELKTACWKSNHIFMKNPTIQGNRRRRELLRLLKQNWITLPHFWSYCCCFLLLIPPYPISTVTSTVLHETSCY